MTCATAAPAQHRYGILQQLSPPRRGCRMQAGAHWPEALFSFSKAACGTSNPYSSSFASEQLGPALARPTSQPPARVHTCSHIRRYDRMHCESPSWSLFWGQADGNGILPRLVVGHSSASASYLVLEIAGLLCARERPLEVANLQPACPRRQERRKRNTEEVHNSSLKKPGASPQGPRMAVRRGVCGLVNTAVRGSG